MYNANKMRLKNAEKEINAWLEKELEKGNSVTLNEVLNKTWKTLGWDYHPEDHSEGNIKYTDYIFYADNSIYNEVNEFPEPEKKKIAEDVVNHPSHYAGGCSIECFDVMRMLWADVDMANYCLINAFKYIWRHKNKNGLEDLRKAEWYMNKAKEILPVSYKWDIAIDLRRQLTKALSEYGVEEDV